MNTALRFLTAARSLSVAISIGLAAVAVPAQSSSTSAAAAAERQDAEERYRRLNATQEELQATLEAQRRRIDALVEEVKSLREENARQGQRGVSRREFEEYVEQLRALDDKREADRKLILSELAKLASAPKPTKPDAPKGREDAKEKEGTQEFIEYEIQPGDVVSAVVQACREKGLKVTLAQIAAANPKVNLDRVTPGQKILIPKKPSSP